ESGASYCTGSPRSARRIAGTAGSLSVTRGIMRGSTASYGSGKAGTAGVTALGPSKEQGDYHMMRLGSATAAALMSLTDAAFAQAPATTAKATVDGQQVDVLVDSKGMTLYTFTKDEAAGAGKSACNGNCAVNWPPLMAAADAKDEGDWTVVTREDGSKMWAY